MTSSGSKGISTDAYRDAICEVIANIRRSASWSDRALAARIGCSASTIRNARNRTTSLDPALLVRIEQEFGPGAIDPFLALANARAIPLPQALQVGEPVLAIVTALHRIIEVEANESDGGRKITPAELRNILDELRQGRAALDGLIARAGGA
jgi:transcriptional regulator with XRE-family HTH domain